MREQSLSSSWAATVALVSGSLLVIGLAIRLIPGRIETHPRRSISPLDDAAFYEATAASDADEVRPDETAPAEPSSPASGDAVEPSSVLPGQPEALPLADVPGSSAPSGDLPETKLAAAATSSPELDVAPAPRRVTVWPSARRLRREARLAEQANAAAESPSSSEADRVASASAAGSETVSPQIVFVPVAVPIPFLEGEEGAAAPPVESTPGDGFEAGLVETE